MQPAATLHPEPTKAPKDSSFRLRLAFGAVVWRVALTSLIGMELVLWSLIRARHPLLPRPVRIQVMLLYTPRFLFFAFLIGGAAAVVADLVVRHLVQPLVRIWYHPRPAEDGAMFHLASNEAIEASVPARRAMGRRWQPGVLARSNLRLWFFPKAWDAEPWALPIGQVEAVRTEPARPLARGYIVGLPDQLVLLDRAGVPERFAVPDPAIALAWFGPPEPRRASG